jgi:hypothetical protein
MRCTIFDAHTIDRACSTDAPGQASWGLFVAVRLVYRQVSIREYTQSPRAGRTPGAGVWLRQVRQTVQETRPSSRACMRPRNVISEFVTCNMFVT